MEKRIGLFGERFAQYVAEARGGLTFFEAAAKVAGVSVKDNFVILAAGTDSAPRDGLWLVFFDPPIDGVRAVSGAE